MVYVVITMSFVFISIGFIVTENNAQYILSGYNTMSEDERKKVDIRSFILFFRKFHIFLGTTFLIISLILTYVVGEEVGAVFLIVYPILMYTYFIWISNRKYYSGVNSRWGKIAIFILIGTLFFLITLFASGFKEDNLIVSTGKIEIEGIYGEELSANEIASIALIDKLPEITVRTNGFSLGNIHKGYYETNEWESVKLIINSDTRPLLLIIKKSGENIYYSARKNNKDLLKELKATMPGIVK